MLLCSNELFVANDAAHALALLQARSDWPRRHRAAEQRDERAPSHLTTSSASNCIELGTARPSALAATILMTSSYRLSKRKDSRYRSDRSHHWVKCKNSNAPAVTRELEEDWGKQKWR